jgi:ABC-type transporter lipoprotein component MlaA
LTDIGFFNPVINGVELVDRRAKNADLIDELFYETEDTYVTLRAAYLQRRRAMAAGEEGEIDNLPDIFDDEVGNPPAQ